MSALPYMPLYVADYLADAGHLTTEEHGAYLLLIMNYWQRGKPLPSDPARLAIIARLSNERWTDVQRTLNEFFEEREGFWHHKRIDDELNKVLVKSEKAVMAGKASARAKSNKKSTDVQQTFNHTDTDTEVIRLDLTREDVKPQKTKPIDQFQILETQLREAAGWEREPHPNLCVIGPVAAVLMAGVDLDLDLLPAARAHGPKLTTRTSWKYIIQAAISNRDNRLKATVDASKPANLNAGNFHAKPQKSNSIVDSFRGVDAQIERMERELTALESSAA